MEKQQHKIPNDNIFHLFYVYIIPLPVWIHSVLLG